MRNQSLLFRVHAVQRMFAREITVQKVRSVVERGEPIEDYSAEMMEPSRLILGFQGRRPLHVVTSENHEANEITIVTAYLPSPERWDKDFKSRRS
jgi:hypothetical protein